MADVSVPRRPDREDGEADRDEDRAQIILITGLTLAVLFVTVVLLLNTVIYTENLATRGVDAGGSEAIEFRDGAVDDLAGILYREHLNSTDNVTKSFAANTDRYLNATSGLRARDGAIGELNVTVTDEGRFVAQERLDDGSFRNMSDATGAADWTLAENVNRTRNYRLTVDPTSFTGGGPFTVVANRSGATWSMSVSDPPSGDGIRVTVDNGTAVSETFNGSGDGNYTIDLTGGTVDGEPFPGFVWAEGVQESGSEFDVRYENGGAVSGTYHFVVDRMDDPPAAADGPYGATPSDRSSQPYVVDGIYSADVTVYYRTPELEYGDVVRLAPGERRA